MRQARPRQLDRQKRMPAGQLPMTSGPYASPALRNQCHMDLDVTRQSLWPWLPKATLESSEFLTVPPRRLNGDLSNELLFSGIWRLRSGRAKALPIYRTWEPRSLNTREKQTKWENPFLPIFPSFSSVFNFLISCVLLFCRWPRLLQYWASQDLAKLGPFLFFLGGGGGLSGFGVGGGGFLCALKGANLRALDNARKQRSPMSHSTWPEEARASWEADGQKLRWP